MPSKLQAIRGRDAAGRPNALFEGPLSVGRHPSNQLVLDDDGVSRLHAVLEQSGDGWRLRDLDSKNGSSVNGEPVVGSLPVAVGDVLAFGTGCAWGVARLEGREASNAHPLEPTLDQGAPPPTIELREHGTGRRVLIEGMATIGRHAGNEWVLAHETISGHHALLACRGSDWRIRDLGSRTGISVDGRRVTGWRGLRPGNKLQLGRAPAWSVEQVSGPGPEARNAEPSTIGEPEIPDLTLTLSWEGENGRVQVENDGNVWSERTGQPFILLWELAASPGAWIEDGQLESALWGAQAGRRSRTALATIIYNARKLFERHGIPAGIVEKDELRTRRTRLVLSPPQVVKASADDR